jgi:hypothetical protein
MSKVKVFIPSVTFDGDVIAANAFDNGDQDNIPVYLGEDRVGNVVSVRYNGRDGGFDVSVNLDDVLLVPVFKAFEPDKGSIAYITMVPRAENKWG